MTVSVCVTTGTEMERETEEEGREKNGTDSKHLTLSSVLLLHPSLSTATEGGPKEVTHSYKHSINLPVTLLVLDSVPAPSVCLPVIAAIQLVPGYPTTGAAMPLQPDAFFLCVGGGLYSMSVHCV